MEQEKRKTERLKEFNEITTTIISGEKNFYNYSEDISVFGAKIRGNIPLPINTLLKIDFTLKNLQQKITALGKVKWTEFNTEDGSFEAGVEFVNTPSDAIRKLHDYISWKMEYKKLKNISKPA